MMKVLAAFVVGAVLSMPGVECKRAQLTLVTESFLSCEELCFKQSPGVCAKKYAVAAGSTEVQSEVTQFCAKLCKPSGDGVGCTRLSAELPAEDPCAWQEGINCFPGKGSKGSVGKGGGYDDKDEQQCIDSCKETDGCNCIQFGDGKCWFRTNCQAAECVQNQAWGKAITDPKCFGKEAEPEQEAAEGPCAWQKGINCFPGKGSKGFVGEGEGYADMSEQQCIDSCKKTDRCNCIQFGGGKCWYRTDCQAAECMQNQAWGKAITDPKCFT